VDGLYYEESGLDLTDGAVIIDLLGMSAQSFDVLPGVRGYSKKLWFDGVNIHLPSDSHSEVWLEMSGSGCRAFETYGSGDWQRLFDFALQYCNITRLDVSFDDHSGILDIRTLFLDTYFEKAYVCRANAHEIVLAWDDRNGDKGSTIYHGSRQSNTCVRIYDKARQLHREDEHWVRVEMELHRENAAKFLQLSGDIGTKWAGVLVNYLRYVDPSEGDSNKWRWPMKPYWSQLVNGAQPIKWPKSPGVEYNFASLDSYVFSQAGNSIRTYIQVFGVDMFLNRLKETMPAMVPEKYKQLIRQLKFDLAQEDG